MVYVEPDCRACRHAYITYEPKMPHGCRFFGFKSARLPHLVVKESDGKPCSGFEPKKPGQRVTRP
ncbi:MAG: hypothetical protein ACI9F9_003372 [Candidatus Paceibacteria bacterium]|jgi:hypothetical protein